MNTKHGIRAMAVVFMAGALACALPIIAQGATSRSVQLTAGAASTVDLGRPVSDILVANPAVVEVGTLRSNRLYLVGKATGDTNVLAFDDQGNQMADIAVHVRVDESNIQGALKRFFPDEKIEARTVKNDVVLTGNVSTPGAANQVRDLAGRFLATGQTVVDLMKVEGEQQVMLKVRVMEAKRSVLREYGLQTMLNPPTTGNTLLDTSFKATGGQTGQVSINPFGTGALFVDQHGGFPLVVGLTAMENNGLVNTLAEPTLTAISGETAGFLAGGEFPVPTGRDSSGNVTIEFKQFGVALNFTPTVLSKDRISLQLSTEVSAKSTNAADGLTLSDTKIPGLTTRRAETTVQIGSGGTLMIAGLIKSEDVHSLGGFPGAQDLPVIGELFKSKSFSRDESELIVMVTPYIVEPFGQPQAVQVSENAPMSPVTAAPAPAAQPGRPQNATATYNPLSQTFIDNLKKSYGNKAPQKPATGASFGYMVD